MAPQKPNSEDNKMGKARQENLNELRCIEQYSLFSQIRCHYNKLYDVLSEVHTKENGKIVVPKIIHSGNNLEKYARKSLIPNTNEIITLAFGEEKGHQKIRDEIRFGWANVISQVFSIKKLLEYNSLREEGGKDIFTQFNLNRARQYLGDLLNLQEKIECRKFKKNISNFRTPYRHRNDPLSKGKPNLKYSFNSNILDINSFLKIQKSKRHK